jgi:hypothetical protein
MTPGQILVHQTATTTNATADAAAAAAAAAAGVSVGVRALCLHQIAPRTAVETVPPVKDGAQGAIIPLNSEEFTPV